MRFAGFAVAAGCAAMGAIAACSNEVTITAEHASHANASSNGSTSSGQGATGVGGASSSGTSVTVTATVGSGGSGSGMCCGPNPIKTITAETDPAQYITVVMPQMPGGTSAKVVDGPFFLTDASAFTQGVVFISTVAGNDCSVPQDQHTTVAGFTAVSNTVQVHAIRLAVASGHALCIDTFNGGSNPQTTFIGFKPY